MKAYSSDHFVLPLPDGHRCPMSKCARLRERVVAEHVHQGNGTAAISRADCGPVAPLIPRVTVRPCGYVAALPPPH